MSSNANMELSLDLILSTYSWKDLPKEVMEFRRKAFIEERGILDESYISGDNDLQGIHFCLYERSTNKLMGATHVCLAEDSDVAEFYAYTREDLLKCIFSSRSYVVPEFRNKGVISILLYAAMQWGRMQGRSFYLGFLEEGEPPVSKLLKTVKVEAAEPRVVTLSNGHSYCVELNGGRIDVAMVSCFKTATKLGKAFISETMFPQEIEATALKLIKEFYHNQWFKGLHEGRMSKVEYIDLLANLHMYVRWTTRLLGRAVAITEDRKLRKHFIEHLRGEIDHEVMLEKDLAAMGVDVSLYTQSLAPNPDIYCFMALQQSLVSFEQDPVLFLAVPIIAEGLSAFLSPTILTQLEGQIRNWGVAAPRSAMTFLRSHVLTDGGEDGHWNAVLDVMCEYTRCETTLQKILTVMNAAAKSQSRAYNKFADARYVFAPRTPIDVRAAIQDGGLLRTTQTFLDNEGQGVKLAE